MAVVTMRSVQKVYPNGFQAIHGIDLDIVDGEFLVLVGPSGCGKSTLLRMVAGLESISDGELHIGERYVNDLEPAQRDIAIVFKTTRFIRICLCLTTWRMACATKARPRMRLPRA